MLVEQVVSRYITRHLAVQGKAKLTRQGYRYDLADFLRWLDATKPSPVSIADVATEDIEDYLLSLEDRKLAALTRRRRLCAIKGLFGYAARQGLVAVNPTRDLPYPQASSRPPYHLDADDADRLIIGAHNPLVRALAATLYMTGLRISEAVDLKLGDIDLKRARLLVRHGKGGKARVVPICGRLGSILLEYLIAHRPGVSGDWFFATASGSLSRWYAVRLVAEEAQRLKLPGRVTPHVLRHTFATHLLANGTDLYRISQLLGHSSTRTTAIYAHIADRQLEEAVAVFDRT